MELDTQACYRAVTSRDRRFDGVFYTAVRTTGIYCRPSCPARTPSPGNVTFHRTAAAAQAAGFRACKRCRPDATPGSPEWDVNATLAGRAMRLIADGVVDREGVPGLATRLGYTPRHLTRLLTSELGAGPLALARARRAQNARVLIETTGLGFADIAFAAGFASVRQFNETVREVYDASPTQLRGTRTSQREGTLSLRLAVRTPFAGRALLRFLASRVIEGIEEAGEGFYQRSLELPHGTGTLRLELDDIETGTGFVPATFTLADLRDTGAAVERARRLLDADCDPVAVREALPFVTPGLRVAGAVDGFEMAVRGIVGQQISVAGARTVLGRLAARHTLRPERLAEADSTGWPMPRSRASTIQTLARQVADGRIALDRGADRHDVRSELLAIRGIGPWTADYVAMRALGDPDIFLPTDVGVRKALAGLDHPETESWAPWRSYAVVHLWETL